MGSLQFVKDGKEYRIVLEGKEVGKMYKDNKRNHMFAVVAKWNFKVKGYRDEVSGKTYKEVKSKAQKMYDELMKHVADGHEIVRA